MAEGVDDRDGQTDQEERAAMLRHLRSLGATDEEIAEAAAAGRAGGLSLEALPPQLLKGFEQPQRAHVARRSAH